MTKKRTAALVFVLALILTFVLYPQNTFAASVPSIKTTLADGALKGSKKTFDVWARDGSGNKIKATVKLNGAEVLPTWDDSEKTSYTLVFTKEGENTVSVSATDSGKTAEKTYKITYKKAAKGEKIGTAVWCVELFTIGNGYLIYPVEVPVCEGETAATELLRLLSQNGYAAYYGGNETKSFYLAYISDGNATAATFSGYTKGSTPKNPKKLEIDPKIPDILSPHLKKNMSYFDTEDYAKNWKGNLGEFVFTNGSGWMYSVNNVFPNVGFADTYLSDGDVVRVSFTLGYGADIGGGGAMGTGASSEYFGTADKTELTRQICLAASRLSESKVKVAYLAAIKVAEKLNATQSETDSAAKAIKEALSKKETVTEPKTEPAAPTDTETPANTPTKDTVKETPKTETPTETPVEETPTEEPKNEPETEVPKNGEGKLPDNTAPAEDPPERASVSPVIFIIIPIVIVAGGGGALYFYMKAKKKK